MTSSHLFFNNVFAETYPELIDLEESFANLRISHMPNLIINKNEEMDNESEINHDETEDSHEEEENDYETEILSKEQLKKFTNIYNKNKIIDDQIIDSDTVEENSEIYISNRTFRRIWHTYLPEIKFLTPRSDLCHTCKEHRFNANYWIPEEKEVKVKQWNDHITWAMKEHEYYRY